MPPHSTLFISERPGVPVMTYQPKEFVQTQEGLIFAVVVGEPEEGRLICSLRYLVERGGFTKLSSDEAGRYLLAKAPHYLFHSERCDAPVHGVPVSDIRRHYRPRDRLRALRQGSPTDKRALRVIRWLEVMGSQGLNPEQVGITGSWLIGAQNRSSDLDFVIYDRDLFHQAREWVGAAISSGEFGELDPAAWEEAYRRRGCEITREEYLWHERRKFNKGLVGGTKFDMTLMADETPMAEVKARKQGKTMLQARVLDDRYAFDHPARYRVESADVDEVMSFTQTYAGQAVTGETIEISGQLEEDSTGRRRVIVGTNREAKGEYIRVIRPTRDTPTPVGKDS